MKGLIEGLVFVIDAIPYDSGHRGNVKFENPLHDNKTNVLNIIDHYYPGEPVNTIRKKFGTWKFKTGGKEA